MAIWLAQAHQAHLTGLYVSQHELLFEPQLVDADIIEALIRAHAEAAQRAKERFHSFTTSAGLPAEWRSMEDTHSDILTLNARYADLTIMGQVPSEKSWARDLPAQVSLGAGRPVLVVPARGSFPRIGERIMVAWNAGREATRAIKDALPLLQLAKQVTVLAINPGHGIHGHGDVPGADICTHLSRHGVHAEAVQTVVADANVGKTLLAEMSDRACDLLVMGAYSHSRVRELALGGVTRYVFERMTTPVFMSH